MLVMALLAVATGCSRQQTPAREHELEATFKESMDGTTLQGNMKGLNKDEMSKGEKFVIEKVNKVAGDAWLFQMRFQYGNRDIPVPVPIRVRWAGDTPVLTLTDVPIPGYGTYTARVLIYGDQYAGMWRSQKGGGGQVFGKLVRNR
jgi:hypothetical protein